MKAPEQSKKHRNLSRLLILIVEDHMVFSRSVKQSLSHHKFEFAQSVEEAIEMYQEHLPDITFLDINLPDGSGFEVLKAIKNFDRDAFVVMLTGSSQGDDVIQSQKAGVNGYIVKPPTKAKLEDCIERYHVFKEDLLNKSLHASTRYQQRSTLLPKEEESKPAPETKPTVDSSPSEHIFEDRKKAKIAALNILFVDNFEANRHTVKLELNKAGFHVDVAANAEEAFEAVKKTYYQLIFIDINLSDTSGYYLTSRIRHYDRIHKKRCFIVGLGEEEKNDSKKWLFAGMNEYIKKPFPVGTLNDFILKRIDEFFEEYTA